jgi:hypothetical protein
MNALMYLSKDHILKAEDRKYQDVDCPEWGGTVKVQSLSAAERDAFEVSIMTGKGKNRDVNLKNLRAKLVIMTAVGEDHVPLFTELDVVSLGQKSAAAMDRVFTAAQKLSGLRPEDIEELTKNSETDQSDDSTSA